MATTEKSQLEKDVSHEHHCAVASEEPPAKRPCAVGASGVSAVLNEHACLCIKNEIDLLEQAAIASVEAQIMIAINSGNRRIVVVESDDATGIPGGLTSGFRDAFRSTFYPDASRGTWFLNVLEFQELFVPFEHILLVDAGETSNVLRVVEQVDNWFDRPTCDSIDDPGMFPPVEYEQECDSDSDSGDDGSLKVVECDCQKYPFTHHQKMELAIVFADSNFSESLDENGEHVNISPEWTIILAPTYTD